MREIGGGEESRGFVACSQLSLDADDTLTEAISQRRVGIQNVCVTVTCVCVWCENQHVGLVDMRCLAGSWLGLDFFSQNKGKLL